MDKGGDDPETSDDDAKVKQNFIPNVLLAQHFHEVEFLLMSISLCTELFSFFFFLLFKASQYKIFFQPSFS